jgi:hypothetical protein
VVNCRINNHTVQIKNTGFNITHNLMPQIPK